MFMNVEDMDYIEGLDEKVGEVTGFKMEDHDIVFNASVLNVKSWKPRRRTKNVRPQRVVYKKNYCFKGGVSNGI